MAEFTERTTSVDTIIRTLKADINIGIYDRQSNVLFNGKVYQLYDNKEFNHFYIEKMLFSFDIVNIVIAE